jgi:hypothetical protein
MQTYDPNIDNLTSPIPPATEMPLNEELARQALVRDSSNDKKTVPQGLIRRVQPEQEKNIDESQMADFSTPIEEVMAGPGQMMQDEMMGSPYGPPQKSGPAPRKRSGDAEEKGSKNPFGLSDEQFQAALAGVAAVVAFSKPVQSRLRTMVPKFVNETGDTSLTGLVVTALIAAIVFYFIKKFVIDRA